MTGINLNTNKLIGDIRFWLILFLFIRFIGITNPPLETNHNWRQTTVTMVARNFFEIDNNILYPRIDICGDKSGITGMEFPLLNYLIYVMSEILGYEHWYGRVINLIVSTLGLLFFYKLLSNYFVERIAFNSTIVLTVSIWFQFSRKIMPDTFSMSLMIGSLYYGLNYLENKSKKYTKLNLLFYFLLMTGGILSKLPSGYLLIIFSLFYLRKDILMKRKIILAVVTLLGFFPIIGWYYHWVPKLVEQYGCWHFFMGKSFVQGFNEILANLGSTAKKFYDTALKFIGFGLFLYGLFNSIQYKDKYIYLIFLISFLGFLVVIFKAGYNFPHHNYYIIPFVPVMALVAGYGIANINNKKLSLFLLLAVSVEGIAAQQHDFRVKEKKMQLLHLESDLNKVSNRNDLVVINSGNYPTPMYFAHRKGWIKNNKKISNSAHIKKLRSKGLKFIVILKNSFGSRIDLTNYKKVFENDSYAIYKL